MSRHRPVWDDDFDGFGGRRRGRERGRRDRQRREQRKQGSQRRDARESLAGAAQRTQPQRSWGAPSMAPAPWRVAESAILDDEEPDGGPRCGDCRHWLNREEPDGRGECEHPGSGFSFPYRDTAGCPFFDPRSRYGGR